MYVCICQAVTEKDIKNAAAKGIDSIEKLKAETGCSTSCGCCVNQALSVLIESQPKNKTNFLTFQKSLNLTSENS